MFVKCNKVKFYNVRIFYTFLNTLLITKALYPQYFNDSDYFVFNIEAKYDVRCKLKFKTKNGICFICTYVNMFERQ